LEQVKKLYQEQVSSQVGELAIVGDFDPEPALKEMAGFLDGWKSETPYRRIAFPVHPALTASRSVIETPDKKNAVYQSGLVFEMKDSDPDYPALLLADFVLGSSPLSSRLSDRVRKKDGLSYGAGSSFFARPQDANATFIMQAICNPLNIDKVEKGMLEELQRFLKDGIEAKELEDGKKGFLENMKTHRGSDSALAGALARGLQLGRTYAFQAEQEKKIQALTVEQVNAAVRKHFDPKKLITVRAGDFKAKPKTEK
jgi:zinc protease